jgi:glyoxylase-like metal-dependent hydrolase (beta-lactamase superfamily II)
MAWYDGRVPGYRAYPQENWIDEGALAVGVASYALIEGDAALVYDPHTSLPHARRIRADLEALGVTRFTVILSHRHMDHIAGTAVFAGCPILANQRTAAHLARDRVAIEAGTLHGPPAIEPLLLPTETFAGRLDLRFGGRPVALMAFDIHSDDGTVLWLPDTRLLLAGDTLEDPITYVAEPGRLSIHLAELDRLATLKPLRILPNHGDPARIGSGGFGPGLIDATRRYTEFLLSLPAHPDRGGLPVGDLLAADLAAGHIHWHDSYAQVHRDNVAAVLAAS